MDQSTVNNSTIAISLEPAAEESHQFSFTGSDKEYFKIWLSNLALTIVTLGFYGPWAKVRREQYFHSHTYLAGNPFEYTASPMKILKGRLVMLAAMLAFTITDDLNDKTSNSYAGVFFLIILLLYPWVLTQGMRFRARYTRYRGLSFSFTGTYFKTLWFFVVLPLLTLLSLGTLYPWVKRAQRRYVMNGLRYGKTAFKFNAPLLGFYRLYVYACMPILIAFLLLGIRIYLAVVGHKTEQVPVDELSALFTVLCGWAVIILIVLISVALKIKLSQLTWNNTTLANFKFRYTITLKAYFGYVISNFFLRIVSLGLAIPYCVVRMYQYKLNNFTLLGADNFGDFKRDTSHVPGALGDEVADLYDLDFDFGF